MINTANTKVANISVMIIALKIILFFSIFFIILYSLGNVIVLLKESSDEEPILGTLLSMKMDRYPSS